MRLDRLVTLYLARPLAGAGGASASRALPVLMYHSISDDPQPELAPYYKTTTSPAVFEKQIQHLSDEGYISVDMDEALRLLQSGQPAPQKSVVITFDDGFRDFYDLAFPILKKHGHTATMYLPTNFIANERRCFKGRECMVWGEVRELRAAGIRFGSHTASHPKLYELAWKEIENELAISKDRIERELGEEVTGFAYPFAFPQQDERFTGRFGQLLRDLGYANCATTMAGRAQPNDNPFCVKRLPVNVCDDQSLFAAKLAGAYDWFGKPQNWAKKARHWLRGGRSDNGSMQPAAKALPSKVTAQDSTL